MRVFRDLDRIAPPETILASNTSGLPIAALAASTDRPDRVIGWHWASPAPVMKLAEIVVTPETSEATIAIVTDAATRCGQAPDRRARTTRCSGASSRTASYFAMVREAQRVVDEGIATRDDVDQLMMDCFRWPSGPFGMVKGAGSGWSRRPRIARRTTAARARGCERTSRRRARAPRDGGRRPGPRPRARSNGSRRARTSQVRRCRTRDRPPRSW